MELNQIKCLTLLKYQLQVFFPLKYNVSWASSICNTFVNYSYDIRYRQKSFFAHLIKMIEEISIMSRFYYTIKTAKSENTLKSKVKQLLRNQAHVNEIGIL